MKEVRAQGDVVSKRSSPIQRVSAPAWTIGGAAFSVFLKANVSQGGLDKILSGERPKPGLWTVKDLADALGTSVSYLIGEDAAVHPRDVEVANLLNALPEEDRAEVIRHMTWTASRIGKSRTEDDSTVVTFPAAEAEAQARAEAISEPEYVFPISKEEFIEKDFDYPQPLHVWVVPELPAAAGPVGIDADFPFQTAQMLHSVRDAHNNLIQVIRVIGESMADVLHHDWLVGVDTTKSHPKNDDIVAVYKQHEGSMLGYWNQRGDNFSLLKENENYDRVDLGDPSEFLIIGTVDNILYAPIRRRRTLREVK